jgi:putative nucleotidyltransferase with HDIG domain
MIDSDINYQIKQSLEEILAEGNEIRSSIGDFPFFDTLVLSAPTQHYLRSCPEWEWEALLLVLQSTGKQNSTLLTPTQKSRITALKIFEEYEQGNVLPTSTLNINLVDLFKESDFTQAVTQLKAYRASTSKPSLSLLILRIAKARQGYAKANVKVLQLLSGQQQTVYKETSFLNLSSEDWAKTQTGIRQSAERILSQGLSPGLPADVIRNAVSLQVQASVPKDAEPLAIKLLLSVLKPNLKKDEIKTTLLAAKAAALVKPVMVTVKKGEIIVNKGEKITSWKLKVLDHYHLIRREVKWLGLIRLGNFVICAVGVFALIEQQCKWRLRQTDRLLVLLLTLSTPLLLTMGIPYTTWSAVGLLLGSYYNSVLSVTVIGLLLLLLPVSLEVSKIMLLTGATGGLLAGCVAQRLHSREELALLSLAIALTEGGVYLVLDLVLGRAFGTPLYVAFKQSVLFALSGLAWSVVALGISPYLEKLFDLVTPIRLAELANPNRPLLKRLATEAPGTFQHTLFVATLAEAAAKQLKCNVELVRAGTLYHDIGKMHDPMAFIENQMGGQNKHDTEIKDPWKSAEIIKKHVSEGLVMARRHSLPTAIQAFIPQHQGTMQITYFYHQALQMTREDPTLNVTEADFRYDGPIPQSRETAIVMLADSCEAALRSLKDASPEHALAMLNNILRARWQDNQMLDSNLTREDMHRIAEIFVQVWQQFHHKRIAYPKVR